MSIKRLLCLGFATTILMTGCGSIDLSVDNKNTANSDKSKTDDASEDVSASSEEKAASSTDISKDDTAKEAAEDSTDISDDVTALASSNSTTGSLEEDKNSTSDPEFGPEEGHYDRTYLVSEDGVYTYTLTDAELIAEYDEKYFDAFKDVYESYEEVMQWQNQSYGLSIDKKQALLFDSFGNKNNVIKLGSYFEMDYDFDLNNLGYTYVDLDSDGTFELIFGVINGDEWTPTNIFERAYAIKDGTVTKICEGGSRDYYWLGNDGHIYNTGSGGAAYSGTWRMHFDLSLVSTTGTDWGSQGFVADEFFGYWDGNVHITQGPIDDIDAQALLPENQISNEEYDKLSEEWDSRQIEMEWLKMTDYMNSHKIS